MGILDAIITHQQTETLHKFKPVEIVREVLATLKERDRQILLHRYGLEGKPVKTLAAIGQEHNLTRERIRQIEKDLVKNLRSQSLKCESFARTKDFLMSIIADHGRIIAEENLLLYLNLKDLHEKNAAVFLLHLIEELENYLQENYKKSWVSMLFEEKLLHDFTSEGKKIITLAGKPLPTEEFLKHFKQTEFYQAHKQELTDKVVLNFLSLAVEIEKNVFGDWGLNIWKDIRPKDVGDKAYLVMKYHQKPEHYSTITEMINKAGFDSRTAYKETVHNELIKDPRFILIGRGIYALAEWGYKPGVVADVIVEILKSAGKPLSREEIIALVLKKRQVKKNTILVGLSNKKLFKKADKNLYALA